MLQTHLLILLLQHSKFTNHTQKSNNCKSYYPAKKIYKPERYTTVHFQIDISSFSILCAISKQDFHHQIIQIVNVCRKIMFFKVH